MILQVTLTRHRRRLPPPPPPPPHHHLTVIAHHHHHLPVVAAAIQMRNKEIEKEKKTKKAANLNPNLNDNRLKKQNLMRNLRNPLKTHPLIHRPRYRLPLGPVDLRMNRRRRRAVPAVAVSVPLLIARDRQLAPVKM